MEIFSLNRPARTVKSFPLAAPVPAWSTFQSQRRAGPAEMETKGRPTSAGHLPGCTPPSALGSRTAGERGSSQSGLGTALGTALQLCSSPPTFGVPGWEQEWGQEVGPGLGSGGQEQEEGTWSGKWGPGGEVGAQSRKWGPGAGSGGPEEEGAREREVGARRGSGGQEWKWGPEREVGAPGKGKWGPGMGRGGPEWEEGARREVGAQSREEGARSEVGAREWEVGGLSGK